MSRGPKAVALDLTEAERAELCRLLRRRGVGQALAQRIRVVLACAKSSATNLEVAEALGVSRQTVATWRGRFAGHHLEGLMDAPRSGALRCFPAWVDEVGVLNPTCVLHHAVRTYSGRPSSSIWFSTSAAIATSIA